MLVVAARQSAAYRLLHGRRQAHLHPAPCRVSVATMCGVAQVSLSVRLAVGMTMAQVATGADVALAQWLAEPATAQAFARMYAPDAVISWLHRPEIWYQLVRGEMLEALGGSCAGEG